MKLDFVVIGASRSGTTWVHDNIIKHPEIFLPKKVNEPTFFTKYYNRGFLYYESLFAEMKDEKAIGEITPDYLYSEIAAQRIYNKYPHIKIILILRNPYERLYSMYKMLHGKSLNGFEHLTFQEAYMSQNEFVDKGKYIIYIQNYLRYFDRKQILILNFDDLKNRPTYLLKQLYDFVGVNNQFKAPYIYQKVNSCLYILTKYSKH